MMESFFLIFKNTFLMFFLIPFSFGSYYKVGVMFFGPYMPFLAKVLGIFFALIINYLIGLLFIIALNKKIQKPKNIVYLFPILCFIPVLSGLVSFYFGANKLNFYKFLFIGFFSSVLYYLLAIVYPALNISL